jgi:hypothetical protein
MMQLKSGLASVHTKARNYKDKDSADREFQPSTQYSPPPPTAMKTLDIISRNHSDVSNQSCEPVEAVRDKDKLLDSIDRRALIARALHRVVVVLSGEWKAKDSLLLSVQNGFFVPKHTHTHMHSSSHSMRPRSTHSAPVVDAHRALESILNIIALMFEGQLKLLRLSQTASLGGSVTRSNSILGAIPSFNTDSTSSSTSSRNKDTANDFLASISRTATSTQSAEDGVRAERAEGLLLLDSPNFGLGVQEYY